MRKFITDECGQGLAEYAQILSLIAIVIVGALTGLGKTIDNRLNSVNDTVITTISVNAPLNQNNGDIPLIVDNGAIPLIVDNGDSALDSNAAVNQNNAAQTTNSDSDKREWKVTGVGSSLIDRVKKHLVLPVLEILGGSGALQSEESDLIFDRVTAS